jgi:hypothetical protein
VGGTESTQGSITFPVNTFIGGSIYQLTVTISKDTRTKSKTVVLTGVDGAGADLLLVPMADRVAVQDPIRIKMA